MNTSASGEWFGKWKTFPLTMGMNGGALSARVNRGIVPQSSALKPNELPCTGDVGSLRQCRRRDPNLMSRHQHPPETHPYTLVRGAFLAPVFAPKNFPRITVLLWECSLCWCLVFRRNRKKDFQDPKLQTSISSSLVLLRASGEWRKLSNQLPIPLVPPFAASCQAKYIRK